MARLTHPNPRLLAGALALALAACLLALTATHKPAQATFPGENGRIVFEAEPRCPADYCANLMKEIYSVDPATAEVSNLTDTPTEFIEDATPRTWLISSESLPRWSPDGDKILFVLDRYFDVCESGQDFCYYEQYTGPDPSGLYTMNADGSGKTRVPNRLGLYAWSPGGKKIAGWGGGPLGGEVDRLRTMYADGSGSRKVFVPRRRGYVQEAPAWSRDGKRLAFVRYERFDSKGEYFPYIHSVKADGTGHRKFAARCGVASGVNWTPDGKRLIFGCAETDADPYYDHDIFSAKPDGSRMRNLTDTPSTEGDVAWEGNPQISPDGEKVGFTKTSGPQDDFQGSFYTMNPDGSAPTKAFDSVGAWVWSPDGKKVAFAREVRSQSGYRHYIVTINVDGSGRKNIEVPNLTDTYDGGITNIDWQPLP